MFISISWAVETPVIWAVQNTCPCWINSKKAEKLLNSPETVAHGVHKAGKYESSYSTKSGGVCTSATVAKSGANAANKGARMTGRYKGTIIFVDHFSDLTFAHLHESLSLTKTIQATQAFEQSATVNNSQVKHHHCNNGRFIDNAFIHAVKLSQQTISFCGVGAHHQNGVAEWCICAIMESSQMELLHSCHCWPEQSQ